MNLRIEALAHSPRPVLCAALLLIGGGLPAAAQSLSWVRQLGTTGGDQMDAAAPDGAGGVFSCGSTQGSLGGPSAGSWDAWLAHHDAAGNSLWTRQIGTTFGDYVSCAASDTAGGFYVGGQTEASLGGPGAGFFDAWFARYDAAGNQLWIRQIGTPGIDYVFAAAPDGSGGVFLAGQTQANLGGPTSGSYDAWLARYDSAGNSLWIRQFGTSAAEKANAVTPDGLGGAYVSGDTQGALGGPFAGSTDAWLAHYDAAGNSLWTRQLGTSAYDSARASCEDGAGGLFVSGWSGGSLGGPSAGSNDAWLARYDAAGNSMWIRQFGTSTQELVRAAVADGAGQVYVVGQTAASLGGPHAGGSDAWTSRYDAAGNLVGSAQLGTINDEVSYGGTSDGAGGLFMGGLTFGSLGGPGAGQYDAWVARFLGQCPGSANYCTALVSSSGCTPVMVSTGSAQLSAPGAFTVAGQQLEKSANGLMFFGTTGQASLPFYGGLLCLNSPVHRMPLKNAGGTIACSGSFGYSLADCLLQPSGGPLLLPGAVVDCQIWFRDPPAALGAGLSDALEFTVCP